MTALEVICGILILIVTVIIIAVVMMQDGNSAGMGAIAGGTEDMTYGRNNDRSINGLLAKWTKVLAVAFFVVIVITNACLFFMK